MKTFTKFLAIAASVVSTAGAIAILRLPLSHTEIAIETALICANIVTAYVMLKLDPEEQLDTTDAELA